MSVVIRQGHVLDVLRTLPSESVQCVVTSPPYFGLRAYGTDPQIWGGDPDHEHAWDTVPSPGSRSSDTNPGPLQHPGNKGRERLTSDLCICGAWRGELGLEPTPALFIEHLVTIFEEVKRVLRPDGLVFCNIGDSYSSQGGRGEARMVELGRPSAHALTRPEARGDSPGKKGAGVPPKNLLLIPQRFAIAMQDAGWYVRSQIVWAKTSAMPESVRDRPTSAWEPIWMFAKNRTYYYDAEAVRQPAARPGDGGHFGGAKGRAYDPQPGDPNYRNGHDQWSREFYCGSGANLRNVWLLSPEPSREQHFAAFPSEIPRRCILAATSEKGACPACGAPWRRVADHVLATSGRQPGASEYSQRDRRFARGGAFTGASATTLGWEQSCKCPPAEPVPCVVLDPFGGSGTTGLVADRLGRDAVLIELNPEYAEMARRRIERDAPMLTAESVTVDAGEQLTLLDAPPRPAAGPTLGVAG